MPNLIPLDRAVGINPQRKYMAQMEDKGNFSPESITMATKILNTDGGKKDYIAQGLNRYPRSSQMTYGNYVDIFGRSEAQDKFPELSGVLVGKGLPVQAFRTSGANAYYDVGADSILIPDSSEYRHLEPQQIKMINHESQHAIDKKEMINKNIDYLSSDGSVDVEKYVIDPLEKRAVAAELSGRDFGLRNLEDIRNADAAGMLEVYKNGAMIPSARGISGAYYRGATPVVNQILHRSW
jgi:hypothetical protein